MNKISAVYKITNKVTGECYVGSSKNVYSRWAVHKCPSTWKQQPNNRMYQDMQKYGVEQFEFEIIVPAAPTHLKICEQEFIDIYHPTYNSIRANTDKRQYKAEYMKQYNRQYYQENRQYYQNHNKQYYQDHKIDRAEYMKQYREQHKEEHAKYMRQYYQRKKQYNTK